MKKILFFLGIIFLLYLAYIIVPFFINSCDCLNKDTFVGSYINTRKDTTNKERLFIYNDSSYIHILSYDSIQFINSNFWENRENQCAFKKWSNPNEDLSTAKEKLGYISKEQNNKRYPNLFGGQCYDDYYFGCIYGIFFDEYNPYFRREELEAKSIDLKNVPTRFYTKDDSISFGNSVLKNNIEILNKKEDILVW